MVCVVRERAQHHVDGRAVLTAAAFVVRNGDNAVYIREALALVIQKLCHQSYLLRLMACAHRGWDNENEVTRADAPIGAAEAFEGRALRLGEIVGSRVGEILGQVANDGYFVRNVRVRDVIALADAEARADGVAVLEDELAGGDVACGETMAGRHRFVDADDASIWKRNLKPRRSHLLDDREVVFGRDDNRIVADGRGLCRRGAGHY